MMAEIKDNFHEVDAGSAAAEERELERAGALRQAQGFNEAAIANQHQALAENEARLRDAEFLAQKQVEERKAIEITSKRTIENEQEALEKARKLAAEQEARRKEAQKELAGLTAEEQEARRRAFEIERQNVPVEMGTEPAVLDVYQHSRYEVGQQGPQLVNAATHVEQSAEAQRATNQHEDKSIVGKIADGIKNIF